MVSVVFVPCNGLQVRRFALVRKHLPPGVNVLSVSNGKFLKLGVDAALGVAGLRAVRLEKMDGKECGRVLDAAKPNLLIVGNDSDYISFLFIQAAKKRGIRSLMIQDGAICFISPPKGVAFRDSGQMLAKYSPLYLLGRALTKAKTRILRQKSLDVNLTGTYCTDIAAWGGFSKRTFLSRGVPASAIHITGNPTFDELPRTGKESKTKPGKTRIILFAASDMVGARLWSEGETIGMFRALAEATAKIKGAKLVIRPHPSEDMAMYAPIKRDYPNVAVSKEGKLFEVIRQSDAVLTEVSTVAFEAILMGKPIGIVDFTDRDVSQIYPEAYIKSGAAISITDPGKCAGQLSALLSDRWLLSSLAQGRKRFIADQVDQTNGKASKRVAWLIMKLAAKGS